MSVKITDSTTIFLNVTRQKASLALRYMADEVVTSAEPHTPKKMGNLRRDVLKEVIGLKAKITWDKNYAAIQENKQFSNYSTPGTGPHFAENAVKDAAIAHGLESFRKAGLL